MKKPNDHSQPTKSNAKNIKKLIIIIMILIHVVFTIFLKDKIFIDKLRLHKAEQ